jgi:hypothetical protein
VSGESFDMLSNAVGLIAVILLALPALYAARFGRLAVQLRNLPALDKTQASIDMHETARRKVEDQRNAWDPSLNSSLLAGTVLAGLSYAIAILKLFVLKGHS